MNHVITTGTVLLLLITAPLMAHEELSAENPIIGVSGESGIRFLPPGPLFTAYASESYSTMNRFELQWANKAPPNYPWAEGYGQRPLVEIRLGVELPVISGGNDLWAWYIGFPLSLDFITDMFQKTTAPVVNTDYWFGTRLEALRRLDAPWPSNIGIRLLPFFHESTHIGDEVALYSADDNPDYYRVNVSYEAWEIAICLDEWEGEKDAAFTIRIGASGRWNSDGYYAIPTDAEIGSGHSPDDFHLSRGRMEYFGQFHAVVSDSFPAIGSWIFQGGMEVRNRILFDYFSEEPERRAWTLISSIGWYRYPDGRNGRRMGFHLRMLTGQNPHGQFREQSGYFVFGTGFSLGI